MPIFDRWDVVAVPFPYTDRPVRQRHPAVIVSGPDLAATHGLLWVVMITAAENRAWADDIAITDLTGAGLPIPSIIRPSKIATIEANDAERRGSLDSQTAELAAAAIRKFLP